MSDLATSDWSEVDASNNAMPPAGFPEGMFPSDLNNSARAVMGAVKRWYGKINPTLTTGGTTTAYTLTSAGQAEAAYYTGQLYAFVANATCGATPTLNIDALGAINLRKFTAGAWANLAAGDIQANQIVVARYNGTQFDVLLASFNIADFVTLVGNNTFTGTNDFTGGRAKVPTRTAGDSGTDAASTAFVTAALLAAHRSYLAGLGTSNNSGTPNSKIDVAAGVCMDDTNAQILTLAATTLDCGTTGANGLDTGSLANSTWYHLFVIGKTDGTTALLASTSLSSPTYPNGYTLKRRISSFKTDASAHILGFLQDGDRFLWAVEINDVVNATQATPSTITLSTPLGLSVEALFGSVFTGSGDARWLIYSGLIADITYSGSHLNGQGYSAVSGNGGLGNHRVVTDTSSRVKFVANSSIGAFNIWTSGWIDRRGRDS
jgi:hypothetical protein